LLVLPSGFSPTFFAAVFFFGFFSKKSNEKHGLPPKKRLFKVLSLTVGVI